MASRRVMMRREPRPTCPQAAATRYAHSMQRQVRFTFVTILSTPSFASVVRFDPPSCGGVPHVRRPLNSREAAKPGHRGHGIAIAARPRLARVRHQQRGCTMIGKTYIRTPSCMDTTSHKMSVSSRAGLSWLHARKRIFACSPARLTAVERLVHRIPPRSP
jgi:hypothetical protein